METCGPRHVPHGSESMAAGGRSHAAVWQGRGDPHHPAIGELSLRLLERGFSPPLGQIPTSQRRMPDHGEQTRSHPAALPEPGLQIQVI